MGEKIKFSVLIPVYNAEQFIMKCINSVLYQTYQNFEIILIDDGSTDLSGKIINEYAKRDIRIKAYHQTNQGLIMTRRKAISIATGDFCLFLDSDDYWDYNLLALNNQIINEYNCDLVIYKYKRVSEKGVIISESKSVFTDKMIFECKNKEELFRKMINSSDLNNLVCKAVKRSIIDDADYSQYNNIKNGEDLLQSVPLICRAKKIVYINSPIYNYRTVKTSMTQTFNFDFVRDITTVRSVLLKYMQELKFDNTGNLKLFYQYYINSILNYIIIFINSNNFNKKEKFRNFDQIKKLQLYIDALDNIDRTSFYLIQKNTFWLFYNNHYQILFAYGKIIGVIRSIKYFFSELKECNAFRNFSIAFRKAIKVV